MCRGRLSRFGGGNHERKLSRKVETDGRISVIGTTGRKLTGLGAVMSAMSRKQLPLCKKHHLEFEEGKYSRLDSSYLGQILGGYIPDADKLKEVFAQGTYIKP